MAISQIVLDKLVRTRLVKFKWFLRYIDFNRESPSKSMAISALVPIFIMFAVLVGSRDLALSLIVYVIAASHYIILSEITSHRFKNYMQVAHSLSAKEYPMDFMYNRNGATLRDELRENFNLWTVEDFKNYIDQELVLWLIANPEHSESETITNQDIASILKSIKMQIANVQAIVDRINNR